MPHAERAGGLRHAFDQKHAGHDRVPGKMSLEIGLVRRDVLDADGRAVAVHLDDAVDEEEWVAMRQKLEDGRDSADLSFDFAPRSFIRFAPKT